MWGIRKNGIKESRDCQEKEGWRRFEGGYGRGGGRKSWKGLKKMVRKKWARSKC